MSRTQSPGPIEARSHRQVITWAVLLVSFAVYALTAARGVWTTDVFGANWTSWHIATTGTPWIDGTRIPAIGHRSDHLMAVVHTSDGHTAFGRFPGVVTAGLPAYLIASSSMSIVPGSLTAALLTAIALALMFSALRRSLPDAHALLATAVFGFTTPVWSVSGNLMWPHTITVLGIAGMAWAASGDRWWWAGVFGGIALWGRLHVALIVAVLGLGVGLRRRDARVVGRMAVSSGAFLVASCAWNRWVYGSWSPLAGYGTDGSMASTTQSYITSASNYLGTWISPDRGILVWTPVVVLLVPALVRSWRSLPDWSVFLLVGGVLYTVVQTAMITFTGGDGFYGYRYGLELLACATPALALSTGRMGVVARTAIGPVLGVQLFAFLLGALDDDLPLPQTDAWHANAFVHELNAVGPVGWIVTVGAAGAGWWVARRVAVAARSSTRSSAVPSGDHVPA